MLLAAVSMATVQPSPNQSPAAEGRETENKQEKQTAFKVFYTVLPPLPPLPPFPSFPPLSSTEGSPLQIWQNEQRF